MRTLRNAQNSKDEGRGIVARSLSRVVLMVALVGFAAPALAANLIKDGSFEKPVVNGSSQFATGDSFRNWTVVGDAGYVTLVNDGFWCTTGISAKKGKQFLNLAE